MDFFCSPKISGELAESALVSLLDEVDPDGRCDHNEGLVDQVDDPVVHGDVGLDDVGEDMLPVVLVAPPDGIRFHLSWKKRNGVPLIVLCIHASAAAYQYVDGMKFERKYNFAFHNYIDKLGFLLSYNGLSSDVMSLNLV